MEAAQGCRAAIARTGTRLEAHMPADVACIEEICNQAREHLARHGVRQDGFTLILGIRETLLNAVFHGSGNNPAKTVSLVLDL